jgi:hypothetical protein
VHKGARAGDVREDVGRTDVDLGETGGEGKPLIETTSSKYYLKKNLSIQFIIVVIIVFMHFHSLLSTSITNGRRDTNGQRVL